MKVFVAIPSYDGQLMAPVVKSLLTEQAVACGVGDEFIFHIQNGTDGVCLARNILVDIFLQTDCEKLMFLDADVSFQPGAIVRLIHKPYDFVGGCYRSREPKEYYPIIFNNDEELWSNEHGVIEVHSLPGGFVTMSRKIFDDIRAAHPERVKTRFDGTPDFYPYFSMPLIGGQLHGEDNLICRDWKTLGGKIYLDPTPTLTHWGASFVPHVGNVGNWLKNGALTKGVNNGNGHDIEPEKHA